jgi:hypothetical protein
MRPCLLTKRGALEQALWYPRLSQSLSSNVHRPPLVDNWLLWVPLRSAQAHGRP